MRAGAAQVAAAGITTVLHDGLQLAGNAARPRRRSCWPSIQRLSTVMKGQGGHAFRPSLSNPVGCPLTSSFCSWAAGSGSRAATLEVILRGKTQTAGLCQGPG